MTCGFVSRGKLAETESVIPAVPVMRIARSPTVSILPLAKEAALDNPKQRHLGEPSVAPARQAGWRRRNAESASFAYGAIGWLKDRNQIADLFCSRPGVRWLDTALHPFGMMTPMNHKTRFANQHSSPRFSDFECRSSKGMEGCVEPQHSRFISTGRGVRRGAGRSAGSRTGTRSRICVARALECGGSTPPSIHLE